LPSLQPLPIRPEFVLGQFCPGFDQPGLASWEGATDQLDGVNAINADTILVVGVEMRPVMWGTGFGIHAKKNPKKARKFWHEFIIPQALVWLSLLVVGSLTK
jgi:hypothetical protein